MFLGVFKGDLLIGISLAYFIVLSQNFIEGTKEIHEVSVRKTCPLAEIQTLASLIRSRNINIWMETLCIFTVIDDIKWDRLDEIDKVPSKKIGRAIQK